MAFEWFTVAGCALLFAATPASADMPQSQAPEMAKLAFLTGSWVITGKMVHKVTSSPEIPTSTIPNAVVHNEWSSPGRDFLITSGDCASPPDNRRENFIRIISYNRHSRRYSVYMIMASGFVETMSFSIQNGAWLYSDLVYGGKKQGISRSGTANRSLFRRVSPRVIVETLQWRIKSVWTTIIRRTYVKASIDQAYKE